MNVGESDDEASACELCERDALNDSGDRRPQGLPAADALAAASASSAAPANSCIQKRGPPKYAKPSPCVRLLEWNSAIASFS